MSEKYNYALVTAPPAEPISVSEAKLHLRVDADLTNDDVLIDTLITAARRWCERYTGRALVQQTWDLRKDHANGCIEIHKVPVQSVSAIYYTDEDGVEQTLTASLYDVDVYSEPARITRAWNATWPDYRAVPNAWRVRFVAGYAVGSPADYGQNVPGELVSAMKLVIGHLYENRENVVAGQAPQAVPQGAEYLAHPYRTSLV